MNPTPRKSSAAVETAPSARRAKAAPAPLRTMPEQIADSITQAIVHGEYEPGDWVREQELAAHFNVSRGPIREALRILEKGGVVRIVPQRGAHVTQLSAKEVNNLFEIRVVLVDLLGRQLATPDPELVEALDREVRVLEQLAQREDSWDDYAQQSLKTTGVLLDACENEKLVEVIRSLGNQTARYVKLGMRDAARRQTSAKSWRKVVLALKSADNVLLGTLLARQVEASRIAALKALG